MPPYQGSPTLRNGPLECVLDPPCGGSIARFTLLGPDGPINLLRPAVPAPCPPASPLDLACFPLVPFSNRIAEGRFHFNGRDVRLPLNAPLPHAIHGHGWLAPWEVEGAEAHAAALVYRHSPCAWPFPYTARQRFDLSSDALTVTLEITNEGDEPMPAGVGLHPYFPKPPGTRLTAAVDKVWTGDATLLPEHLIELPETWNLPAGIVMDDVVLDHSFAGWVGEAVIDWPERGFGLRLRADDLFGHLVVWSPGGEPWFCVEPVTHLTDAVNRSARGATDTGLRILAPGETLAGRVRFEIAAP